MLLAIDAGNTRTKWATFNEAGELKHHHVCANAALGAADFSPTTLNYDRVVISNVAGEQHAVLLANLLAPHGVPISFIKSSLQACNVDNGYAIAETLGSDRWAALIAAWHIKHAPCVVVNAGTAVTIDALARRQSINHKAQAEFIGGLILPGLNLMQRSLGLATAKLPTPSLTSHSTTQTSTSIFAKNTEDAISAGALHAIVGAITQMANALNLQCKQMPYIVISGGNAEMIHTHLLANMKNQTLVNEHLVLHGLFLLENFMQSDTQ